MGFKDLMKNAQEKAGVLQEAYNQKQQEKSIRKEEEAQRLAEIKAQVSEHQEEVAQSIIDNFNGNMAFDMPDSIYEFTKEFFEKLLLPANSSSNSKITMYPYHDKIVKKAVKKLGIFDASENPLFQFQVDSNTYIIFTPTKCYVTYPYPDNPKFSVEFVIPMSSISDLAFEFGEESYEIKCNGICMIQSEKIYEFDQVTIRNYLSRLKNQEFIINEAQIDAIIREKIGAKILETVKEYIFEDEILVYFAWGLDSITAKDYIVCTNKQIIILDREMLGITKNVKQFYYEDITSMGTDQKTTGVIDLALTAAFKLCSVTIYVAGSQEKIETLFTREADRVIRIYQEYRRNIKNTATQPKVVVQQSAPAEDDVFIKLEKLNKLKLAGILSDQEFEEKKAQILSEM